MSRFISISDFLTDEEIKQAIKLGDRTKIRDEIIAPNLERINQQLGQENDPDYLSFLVEYVLTQTGVWK